MHGPKKLEIPDCSKFIDIFIEKNKRVVSGGEAQNKFQKLTQDSILIIEEMHSGINHQRNSTQLWSE